MRGVKEHRMAGLDIGHLAYSKITHLLHAGQAIFYYELNNNCC
jgi:hypothetical protein